MRYLFVLALLVAACSKPRAPSKPDLKLTTPVTQMWGVPAVTKWGGNLREGAVCTDTKEFCEYVRREALKWGAWRKIQNVGECRLQESRPATAAAASEAL